LSFDNLSPEPLYHHKVNDEKNVSATRGLRTAPEVGLRSQLGFDEAEPVRGVTGAASAHLLPVVHIKQTTVTRNNITNLHTEKGFSSDQEAKLCSVPGKPACEQNPNIPVGFGSGFLCFLCGAVR
jgi:hypothetical protein